MKIREALVTDIPEIQIIRHAVKENILSDPNLVTDADCFEYITNRGKGWVCEMNNLLVGFAIADLRENNIWALFILPEYEKWVLEKITRHLVEMVFSQTDKTVWLSTSPNTRAEKFYRNAGWKEVGVYGKNEIKFEMSLAVWQDVSK